MTLAETISQIFSKSSSSFGDSKQSVESVKLAQSVSKSDSNDEAYEGVPQGVKLRSFIDAPATRTAIMDNVLDAVKKRFPIEDDDVRLELRDVKYEGPISYTLEQQKSALLSNRRLGCSLSGTWRLTDKKTGQVLDERRDGVIRVPYYTDRGTIINNGNEYTVISQARLSPGVYVRRKQNGELESQFNVENGLGFRIGLNRETGVLNMSVGQGHVPLYPILHALGVSYDDMRKSWGNEVADINLSKVDPKAIDKVYARYAGYNADMSLSPGDKAKIIQDALSRSKLSPSVVMRTLGLDNVDSVTGQVMLRAAQKLLNINRGEEDPDERDNPRFSKFYGVEDMMRERIDKDAGRLTKSLLFRAKRDKNLSRIGRNALAPYLDTFLSGSGLAMPGEEANPLSILTQQSRITRLGEGGISSPDLVTPEARNVQGDYLGYVDFISGPESFGIGIDVRAALGTMKGSDHRLYNKMLDLHTGKTRYVALDDAASHTVAFPGQDPKAPKLYAMRKGVPTLVSRDEVDFMVPGFCNTVSAGINMTPMPTAVQAGRQFYMSKFWEQYLPQKEGEVPLVDSLMDDGKTTYSEFYGRKVGCITAPFAGTVTKVNDKEIVIRGKDGRTHTASLVNGLPFNRMTSISFTPQVKKGDEIAEGGILANSNFTDAKTGAMNMGRNLKVAVLTAPNGASSFEDAIVISESAAKKLATSRTYGFDQDTRDGVKIQRNKYIAAFPNVFNKKQVDTIDDNGVVKVGTVLHRDDPMILAIGPKMLSAEDAQLGKLSSVLRNALTDKSQKWEHDWPGVVTDVVAGPHGVKVLVKSEPPVKIGDKICGEMGLKGVVGSILDDDKMPRDAVTNERYDMLMNPMGFLSRVAPGQVMLMNLAKVAKKTGKQIRIPQIPPPEGWQTWVEKQMIDNGVKESADVFDPQTGRTINNVGDGYVYTKAFHHLAEKKFSARGIDGAYTQDEQPAKGGEYGAKRMSGFDALALLSHGATDVIKDAMTVRGGMNQEYWRRYRLGLPVEEPDVPFIYTKFINTLKAGGVNVVEKGDVTSIMPQTDADIDEMAQGRVIDSSQMVDADMNPVNGGLFDLGRTGGMGGNRWSMIVLPEAVPNPIMEEPVRRVLNLTAKRMEAILSGREELNGKTGGEAIKDALANLNVDEEIEKARAEIQNRRGSQRDNAIKTLGYLKAAKEMGKRPEEWMITRVPVLPPMFRPVARMGDVALVPDMNELYKELIEMKRNYEDLSKELPASALADERLAVYGAVKAAYGLGDPITAEGKAKNLKGAIRQVIGTVPKCYDSDTELLTKRGWIRFGKITQDDIVATVNPETLKLEWQQPSDVIHSVYNGMMVHTSSNKIDLLVTPNHSHFISSRVGSTSKDFIKGRSKWNKWSKIDAADLMYRGMRCHMLTAPSGYDGSGEPEFPGVKDKLSFAFLCGMYVAEGWDTTYSVNIYQTSANEDVCNIIREKFSASGIKYTENSFNKKLGKKSIYWTIYSKEAALWFRKNFGHLAGGKMISKEVLEWNSKYLRQFIDGYLYGDGEKSNCRKDPSTNKTFYNKDILTCNHSRASTTSRILVDCMAELCMKIGLGFRLTNIVKYDNPKWSVQYRFRIDGWNKVVLEGRKFHKWEMYNGLVHCVTVPNGLLVVRRRGFTAVSGNSGMFQAKVISKTQDNVGRSVTIPDKNLDMDQIGIPEDMAWEMYKPHVERKLVQRGYSPIDVKKMIDEKNPTARHILEDVMEERPVLMDRAPTWHKFNIMAFRPHIVSGRSIHVCPLIDSAYNMDHDGDECRSPYITTFLSDDFIEKRLLTRDDGLCYNSSITNLVMEGRAMRRESIIVDGKNVAGVIVNMRWDEFPHYDNPTMNSHPNARFYAVPEGVCVRAYDEKTGNTVWAPVRYWSHHGVNEKIEIITVELSSGRQILTDDDPRGVYGIDPQTMTFGRWRPSEAVGKFVPRCIKDDHENVVVDNISASEYSDGKLVRQIRLDRESGWLFGAMIGDGWATYCNGRPINICFCFDRNYNNIGEAFKCSVEHTFYDEEHVHFGEVIHEKKNEDGRYGDVIAIRHASCGIGNFIGNIIGHGAENKHLPPFWHNAPKEFKLGLFEGLMDTDGTLAIVKAKSKKNTQLMCNYTTVSMTLATEFQYLCRTLGIDSKLTTQKTPSGGKCWQVSVSTKNLKALGLKLKSPHKAKALCDSEVKSEKSAGGRKYMIPVPVNDLKRVSSIILALDRSAYITMNRTSKLGYVPTTIADKIAKVLRSTPEIRTEAWNVWLDLYDNIENIIWERVEGFTKTGMFEDGFDLTVPGYETFMNSEGVILSNTVNIHVPASDKASKQALDKMLPSKNLFSLTDMKSMRYKPEKEQISGLWALTRGRTRKPVRYFNTKADAIAAYRNGEIGPNDPVEIKEI